MSCTIFRPLQKQWRCSSVWRIDDPVFSPFTGLMMTGHLMIQWHRNMAVKSAHLIQGQSLGTGLQWNRKVIQNISQVNDHIGNLIITRDSCLWDEMPYWLKMSNVHKCLTMSAHPFYFAVWHLKITKEVIWSASMQKGWLAETTSTTSSGPCGRWQRF